MFHKGKLVVFAGSFLIAVYGLSAAFYGKAAAGGNEAYKELRVFVDVFDRVKSDYVEAPNMNTVQEGAMRGLIDALDPYSSFLTKEQYDSLQKRKASGNAGVGIVLSKRSDVIYIVAVEHNSAAAEAGIRPGDYLLSVNGQDVENLSILEVDSFLRGTAGSTVKLTLFRSGITKPLILDMAFKNPIPNPVNSKMLDGNVGFLGVSSLSNSSAEEAKVKLKTLISAGAKKLILDLRDCADGTPSDGADLANYFMRSGVIYFSRNRQGEKVQVVEANAEKYITDLPLVVLIDGTTASAAEIAAGALKDSQRATVVGEKSFGIGSSQKTIQLKSGGLLILSTAKFCTPSGKIIQDETATGKPGILPDVQAPDDEKQRDLMVDSIYDEKDDAAKYKQYQETIDKIQLEKALEILSKGAAPAKKAA